MKTYLLLILFSISAVSCKSKKDMASSASSTTSLAAAAKGETVGKVSHEYKAAGCTSVIVVPQEGGDPLVLIPKDKLGKDLDKDGLEIRFNYTVLRMPQPEGCSKGMPAQLTDISLK